MNKEDNGHPLSAVVKSQGTPKQQGRKTLPAFYHIISHRLSGKVTYVHSQQLLLQG